MTKKLLLFAFILLNVKVFVAQSSSTVPPTISNFRINSSTPNRIYFDSSESITASTISGFDLKDHEGVSITGISINAGQLDGHYFKVSSDFKWYHNNTFNYNGGSNIESVGGVGLNKFDLQYIKNNIPVPELSGVEYYVDASVSSSGNGLSESEAFKTIQEGVDKARAGDKVWIKRGIYNENVVTVNSGTESAPIFIEGYKSDIGDITSVYYNYGDGDLDSSEMPMLDGEDRTSGVGIKFETETKNVILKNIQIQNYKRAIESNRGNQKNILQRIVCKDLGTNSAWGYGIKFGTFADDGHYNKFIDCLVLNASHMSTTFSGDNNLVENFKSYCDEVDDSDSQGLTTDYYFYIEGNNNIIRNSLADKHINAGHFGHSFGTKYVAEYNLIEFCTSINIQDSFAARHSTSKYNVFRDSEAHADVSYRHVGFPSVDHTAGISWLSGGTDNIFDRMYIHHLDDGIFATDNSEDGGASGAGSRNIVKNSIFHNLRHGFRIRNNNAQVTSMNDNEFYNNTWYNIENLFKIYISDGGVNLSGNKIKNNIFEKIDNLYLVNPSKYTSVTGFSWDTNNFFNSWGTEGQNTLAVDPQFVNVQDNNFRLQPESECIDAGLTLDEVKTDFDSNSRIAGVRHDMGAFEDQSDVANAGSNVTICSGSSITLTGSGTGDYSWNTGETTQNISVSPSTTTTYTLSVTNENSTTTDTVVVIVNELPTADAGLDLEICNGTETVLTASGGDTYLWSNGETTESINVSPTETTTYSVTVSNNGCTTTAEDEVIVTVNQTASLDAGDDVDLCIGSSITLTASGADNYLWNTGEETASITVSPTSNTTYTVTSTLGNCSVSDEVIVSVDNPPTINLGVDMSICSGENITLTAEGNGDFIWSTGETTSSITVSPTTTTTYSVSASSSCSAESVSDEIVVEVNATPNVDAGSNVTIELGTGAVLTATGEGDFLWSTGETTSSINVNPTETTTYTITSTLNGACSSQDSVIVTVEDSSQPVVANAGEDLEICTNSAGVLLTATGGETYLWNTGETTANITVSPSEDTVYSVTVSNSHSIDTDEVMVFVNQNCSETGSRTQTVKEMTVYPNPTNGQLNIELNGFSNELNVSLISLNGSIIYTESFTNDSPNKILLKQLDLSRFGKGVYFVRVINNSDVRTKKILVI